MAGARINVGVRTGEACIINTGATVDHDCLLAEAVHVCPGHTWPGMSNRSADLVRHRRRCEAGHQDRGERHDRCRLRGRSDVPDDATVAGNPARDLVRRSTSRGAKNSPGAGT